MKKVKSRIRPSKICREKGHHDWPKTKLKDGTIIYGARCKRCGKKHHSRVMSQQEQFEAANARERRRGRKIRIQRPQPTFRMSAGPGIVVPFPSRWAKLKHKVRKHFDNKREKRNIRKQRTTQNRGGS